MRPSRPKLRGKDAPSCTGGAGEVKSRESSSPSVGRGQIPRDLSVPWQGGRGVEISTVACRRESLETFLRCSIRWRWTGLQAADTNRTNIEIVYENRNKMRMILRNYKQARSNL